MKQVAGRLLLSALIGSVILVGVSTLLVAPVMAARPCICLAIYNPVICNDGVVYSNSCYARCAGAHGCHPYDDGI